MADIVEIKNRLNDRVMSVCELLLPNGRKEGNEWRAGSTGGEKGRSLGVHLNGMKTGVWADFGGSEGGDLIALWMSVKGQQLPEALDDIRSWLGISRPEPYRDPKPDYQRPERPKCSKPANSVKTYLNGRGIPDGILDVYRVAEQGDKIIFPFLLPNGELVLAKARKAEDGAKPVPTAANCEPILFGWQAVPPNARDIIITEGEIDALSWATYGHPAMSVPFGGGNPVTIWCDSQYCVKGVNEWMPGWKAKGWQRAGPNAEPKNRIVMNVELWKAIDEAFGDASKNGRIVVRWVRAGSCQGTEARLHARARLPPQNPGNGQPRPGTGSSILPRGQHGQRVRAIPCQPVAARTDSRSGDTEPDRVHPPEGNL